MGMPTPEVVRVASGVDAHHKATPHDVGPCRAGPWGAHHLAVKAVQGRGGQKSGGGSSRHAPLVFIPHPRNWHGDPLFLLLQPSSGRPEPERT